MVAGCGEEGITDHDQTDDPVEESMFARYMAFGGSFTAGYQSSGINAQTQGESYAVLVARAIGAEFNVPEIEMPGCPAPVTNAFTGERLGEESCRLRESVPELIHNVAVPGMHLADIVPADGDPARENPYVPLMLGGHSPLEIAAEVRPTFVTLWFGGEQYMEELVSGKPLDNSFPFRSYIRVLVDSLEALGVRGGVIIVPPMLDTSPYWSEASEYLKAKEQGQLPEEFEIAPNCAADSSSRGWGWKVPFPHGFGDLWARSSSGESVLLDCKSEPVVDPAYWAPLQNGSQLWNWTSCFSPIRVGGPTRGHCSASWTAPDSQIFPTQASRPSVRTSVLTGYTLGLRVTSISLIKSSRQSTPSTGRLSPRTDRAFTGPPSASAANAIAGGGRDRHRGLDPCALSRALHGLLCDGADWQKGLTLPESRSGLYDMRDLLKR